ncbi:MAG: hypothetical protein CM15mP49_10760 [Actinomycetota bacterium]|nr:MAG: hypothetical protein CM15mP49_10760 [Actinomycetota bacterium]
MISADVYKYERPAVIDNDFKVADISLADFGRKNTSCRE